MPGPVPGMAARQSQAQRLPHHFLLCQLFRQLLKKELKESGAQWSGSQVLAAESKPMSGNPNKAASWEVRAMRLGFGAKLCVHPAQSRRCMTPSCPDETSSSGRSACWKLPPQAAAALAASMER